MAESLSFPIRTLRGILRHYPLIRPRNLLLGMLPPVPDQPGTFAIKHGLGIAACYGGDDPISKSLFWLGDFDPWVDQALARLVRPGDTACDIGANIGAVAIGLGRRVGPSGKVFCFEPLPPHIEKLKANLNCNGLGWVSVMEMALSSAKTTLEMFMPAERQQGMARVGHGEESARRFQVPADTFDHVAQDNQIGRVAVCKIDVEGHERNVFAGMSRTLAAGAIEAFVFERHIGIEQADEVVVLLRDHGYRVFRLYKSLWHGVPAEVLWPAPSRRHRGEATVDFVAVKTGSQAEERWVG